MTSFAYDEDYDAFEKAPGQAVARSEMRLSSCCLRPNHRHLVVSPQQDGERNRCPRGHYLAHPIGSIT
jgi:hypothetical protein